MRSVIAAVVAFLLTCLVLVAIPVIALGSQSPTGGICGPGGTEQSVANVTLDAEQLANAATIAAVTQSRALPPYAATIARATAMQETTLRNITAAVDHDSLGLFQQRVIYLSLIHISEPTRLGMISYAVFCLK